MPKSLSAGLVFLFAAALQSSAVADELKATGDLRWHRGNMHTHSHWSDGDDYLEAIAMWYRDHDYDFLVFTDHNVLPTTERWVDVEKSKGGRKAFDKLKAKFPDWVEERETEGRLEVRLRRFDEVSERIAVPDEFLLIQGEEISDKYESYPIHMNASHVREVLKPRGGNSVHEVMQRNLDAVMAVRKETGQPTMIHLNHPNFGYAVTAEDMVPLVGERFFEVYNGHPGVHNSGSEQRASTERIWDIVNTKRLVDFDLPLMYGLATDDGHSYHNIPSRASEPGRAWVMVLAETLSPEALIESLEAGRFYATNGVMLKSIITTPKSLTVEVGAKPGETYTIDFIGTRKGFDPSSKPVVGDDGKELHTTRVYSADIGTTLQSSEGEKATYTFQGDEIYVRARVTSSADHPNPSEIGDKQQAWVQPVMGPGGAKSASQEPATGGGRRKSK
ncbi:MAG: hypothetical protein M3552_09885 [Planctomycetota bacterium]|nr:hypothetical protein [Planctomycetaceae bacterium]MDQ3330948.1 hypothetical protein [Planctomycetota bacterium]